MDTEKLDPSLGFVHNRDFTDKTVEFGFRTVKIGEAADKALRHAYAEKFTSVHQVASAEDSSSAVVIEPRIADWKYRTLGSAYVSAEVTYEFSLVEPKGRRIAAWTVHAFAEVLPDPNSREGAELIALQRAVEKSSIAFLRSFDRVPELVRWKKDLPLAESEASTSAQQTETSADGWTRASYPGVLSLRVKRDILPMPRPDPSRNVPEKLPTCFRLELQGDVGSRLSLDPNEIQWRVRANQAEALLRAAPPGLAATFAVDAGALMPMPPPGVGIAALPLLFAALANEGTRNQARKDFAEVSSRFMKEALQECGPDPGSCSGLVYFLATDDIQGGELLVPVIDTASTVRYVVKVPLPSVRLAKAN